MIQKAKQSSSSERFIKVSQKSKTWSSCKCSKIPPMSKTRSRSFKKFSKTARYSARFKKTWWARWGSKRLWRRCWKNRTQLWRSYMPCFLSRRFRHLTFRLRLARLTCNLSSQMFLTQIWSSSSLVSSLDFSITPQETWSSWSRTLASSSWLKWCTITQVIFSSKWHPMISLT